LGENDIIKKKGGEKGRGEGGKRTTVKKKDEKYMQVGRDEWENGTHRY